jgi:hypothetical protein
MYIGLDRDRMLRWQPLQAHTIMIGGRVGILIPRDRTWQNLCGSKFVRLRETLSLSKVKPIEGGAWGRFNRTRHVIGFH